MSQRSKRKTLDSSEIPHPSPSTNKRAKKENLSSSSSSSSHPSTTSTTSSSNQNSEPTPLAQLFDADGKLLATFQEASSNIILTKTLSGAALELEALLSETQPQTQAPTLRLIQHRAGDNSKEVEAKRVATLRHELKMRTDDVLAVKKQTEDKIDELARQLATQKQIEDEVDVMTLLKDEVLDGSGHALSLPFDCNSGLLCKS